MDGNPGPCVPAQTKILAENARRLGWFLPGVLVLLAPSSKVERGDKLPPMESEGVKGTPRATAGLWVPHRSFSSPERCGDESPGMLPPGDDALDQVLNVRA
jgi:hypothetical protein